jgi:hypothetical protein
MSGIKKQVAIGDVEEAQLEWFRQQALWAIGYPQHLNGVLWCFGCDRPGDDCQCGHGARWLGPARPPHGGAEGTNGRTN